MLLWEIGCWNLAQTAITFNHLQVEARVVVGGGVAIGVGESGIGVGRGGVAGNNGSVVDEGGGGGQNAGVAGDDSGVSVAPASLHSLGGLLSGNGGQMLGTGSRNLSKKSIYQSTNVRCSAGAAATLINSQSINSCPMVGTCSSKFDQSTTIICSARQQ